MCKDWISIRRRRAHVNIDVLFEMFLYKKPGIIILMKDKINAWDKKVAIEKSNYVDDENIIFYNKNIIFEDNKKPTMIDLFCGAGGFSVGCEWAGFQPVFGTDHYISAMDTWMYNHPNSIGCLANIKKINPYDVKEMLEKKNIKHINLITGGVPCQGFSIANRKHSDTDERNYLFKDYMKFVEVFKPEYIILENVSGMRSTANGKFEEDIKKAMEDLNYSTSVKLINSANYGVPQLRQRLIFVGVRNDSNLEKPFKIPDGEKNNYQTVYDAISDLPELGNNQYATEYDERKKLTEYQKLMRGFGEIKGIKKAYILNNHKAPNHPEETIKKINSTKPGEPMYPKFKQRIRLNYDEPSPTQLAGGIRPQFQFGHPSQPRGLTIRERARIQSFPDYYIFTGGMVQERVQTGNAVPPLLVYNIVKPMYKNIKEEKKKNV